MIFAFLPKKRMYLEEVHLRMGSIPNYFVVIMGVGTVFIGLICIIILCKIIGLFCKSGENKSTAPATVASAPVATQPIANKQEIISAVSAAVAEELGTDVSAIRILSFKKI